MMTVQIHDATPSDADEVRQVQQRNWLATYPNAELGITKEDIEARFHASSEEAISRFDMDVPEEIAGSFELSSYIRVDCY